MILVSMATAANIKSVTIRACKTGFLAGYSMNVVCKKSIFMLSYMIMLCMTQYQEFGENHWFWFLWQQQQTQCRLPSTQSMQMTGSFCRLYNVVDFYQWSIHRVLFWMCVSILFTWLWSSWHNVLILVSMATTVNVS